MAACECRIVVCAKSLGALVDDLLDWERQVFGGNGNRIRYVLGQDDANLAIAMAPYVPQQVVGHPVMSMAHDRQGYARGVGHRKSLDELQARQGHHQARRGKLWAFLEKPPEVPGQHEQI